MNDITAVLTVLEYNANEPIIYKPIKEIFSNKDDCIDISILLSAITKEMRERTLTLNIIHAKSIEDGHKLRIYPAILKQFEINRKTDDNRVRIKSSFPQFASHRNDVKFNLKNITIFGKGTYTIVLNELTEDEVFNNPKLIIEKAIAYYSFEVK